MKNIQQGNTMVERMIMVAFIGVLATVAVSYTHLTLPTNREV